MSTCEFDNYSAETFCWSGDDPTEGIWVCKAHVQRAIEILRTEGHALARDIGPAPKTEDTE
jgi:hypothetical protein